MGKDPLWQIDDSIITGDLQAVQDSPRQHHAKSYNGSRKVGSGIGKDPKILGKGGLVAYTQQESMKMAWIFSLSAESGSDQSKADKFVQHLALVMFGNLKQQKFTTR